MFSIGQQRLTEQVCLSLQVTFSQNWRRKDEQALWLSNGLATDGLQFLVEFGVLALNNSQLHIAEIEELVKHIEIPFGFAGYYVHNCFCRRIFHGMRGKITDRPNLLQRLPRRSQSRELGAQLGKLLSNVDS
jgi:hypothetical protein